MTETNVWFLRTAAYGIVNANATWQMQSHNVMSSLGLIQSKHVSQLFSQKEDKELVLLVSKIVDDLKFSGEGNRAKVFINAFDKQSKLGRTNSGPGALRFLELIQFKIQILQ